MVPAYRQKESPNPGLLPIVVLGHRMLKKIQTIMAWDNMDVRVLFLVKNRFIIKPQWILNCEFFFEFIFSPILNLQWTR